MCAYHIEKRAAHLPDVAPCVHEWVRCTADPQEPDDYACRLCDAVQYEHPAARLPDPEQGWWDAQDAITEDETDDLPY